MIQTLTNYGWKEVPIIEKFTVTDDKVFSVNEDGEIVLKSVSSIVMCNNIMRIENGSNFYTFVPTDGKTYAYDEESKKFLKTDAEYIANNYKQIKILLPNFVKAKDLIDYNLVRKLRGFYSTDKTIANITSDVIDKKIFPYHMRIGTENIKKFLSIWKERYGRYFVPSDDLASMLQALLIVLGEFSKVKITGTREVIETLEQSYFVTGFSYPQNMRLNIFRDKNNEKILCIRREIETGKIFIA